jgi:hypothetical protein
MVDVADEILYLGSFAKNDDSLSLAVIPYECIEYQKLPIF